MESLNYIQKIVDYIETHIHEDITAEECAQRAGYSKYHFHRIFTTCVGMPVMTYVRKRKLTYAMRDVSKGRRLIDIAYDYGYSSERSFSRAFIQEFLSSPSQFRGCGFKIPHPLDLNKTFKQEGSIMKELFSEVYFETLESMAVASAVIINQNPEEEVIQKLTNWAQTSDVQTKRSFGFDVPVSEELQQQGIRGYEYWIELANPQNEQPCNQDITIKSIESCKYAVLKITDPFIAPFERIPQGWKQLVQWIMEKGYTGNPSQQRYCLEEVIEEDGITYMKVMIPIN